MGTKELAVVDKEEIGEFKHDQTKKQKKKKRTNLEQELVIQFQCTKIPSSKIQLYFDKPFHHE